MPQDDNKPMGMPTTTTPGVDPVAGSMGSAPVSTPVSPVDMPGSAIKVDETPLAPEPTAQVPVMNEPQSVEPTMPGTPSAVGGTIPVGEVPAVGGVAPAPMAGEEPGTGSSNM